MSNVKKIKIRSIFIIYNILYLFIYLFIYFRRSARTANDEDKIHITRNIVVIN